MHRFGVSTATPVGRQGSNAAVPKPTACGLFGNRAIPLQLEKGPRWILPQSIRGFLAAPWGALVG